MSPNALTFVVGTGRCGSTLLSRILHRHPDVLSVSEFFAVLRSVAGPEQFLATGLDGPALWRLLSGTDPLYDAMIRDGLRTAEMRYPYGSGRYDPATGVPVLCHGPLPALTDDPDTLFDRLAEQIPAWPARPAAAHYRALFRLLAGIFGRRVVVERSAASLPMVADLHRHFPEARFVHLHRDGPDCALSMSRHPIFRRAVLAAAAARAAGLPVTAAAGEIQAAAPRRFDGMIAPPIDWPAVMACPIPVTVFARSYWSPMVCAGMAALSEVPAGQRISIRYEDVLAHPETELARLARFAGAGAPARWLDGARQLIGAARTVPVSAPAMLDPASLAGLREACRPGTAAIAGGEPAR